MTIPELPPVSYWRSPRPGNAGVLYDSRREAVANGEQVCEDLYSAEQMRAFYLAGMEAAAQSCEPVAFDGCNEWRREAVDKCIAAIRAEAAKGAK